MYDDTNIMERAAYYLKEYNREIEDLIRLTAPPIIKKSTINRIASLRSVLHAMINTLQTLNEHAVALANEIIECEIVLTSIYSSFFRTPDLVIENDTAL
jgi:hypothetical protein